MRFSKANAGGPTAGGAPLFGLYFGERRGDGGATSAMRAWALFYLCTTSRLEGSIARSAARQPAACRRVLVARAHLIGSELRVNKLEEFFSILPYTLHIYNITG